MRGRKKVFGGRRAAHRKAPRDRDTEREEGGQGAGVVVGNKLLAGVGLQTVSTHWKLPWEGQLTKNGK